MSVDFSAFPVKEGTSWLRTLKHLSPPSRRRQRRPVGIRHRFQHLRLGRHRVLGVRRQGRAGRWSAAVTAAIEQGRGGGLRYGRRRRRAPVDPGARGLGQIGWSAVRGTGGRVPAWAAGVSAVAAPATTGMTPRTSPGTSREKREFFGPFVKDDPERGKNARLVGPRPASPSIGSAYKQPDVEP